MRFLDRFAAAAADGFKAVEYLFPYEYPAAELAARLKANGLQQVLFNAPPGDWAAANAAPPACPAARPSSATALRARSSTRARSAARAST